MGLLFLIAVATVSGIGILLFPLLIVMAFFLRIIISFLLLIFAVWLLGKFIIWAWEKIGKA